MKPYLLLFFIILITACTETPEVSPSKETVAKEKIKNNQTEAQVAQVDYLELQKRRGRE